MAAHGRSLEGQECVLGLNADLSLKGQKLVLNTAGGKFQLFSGLGQDIAGRFAFNQGGRQLLLQCANSTRNRGMLHAQPPGRTAE